MSAVARSLGAALALSLVAMACGNRSDVALIEEARAGSLAVAEAPAPRPAGQVAGSLGQPAATGDTGGLAAVDQVADQTVPDATAAVPADVPTSADADSPSVVEAAVDTRLAPPGGNGGATDVGVTADEIVIGNVADITGAVAGLFADVQKAALAWELYFNTTVGTIWGRRVRVVPLDTQLTRNGNFAAYTDLCDTAFMGAASMSGFDEGIVAPIRDCPGGFPDLRTAAVNPEAQVLPSVFSTDSMRPKRVPLTELNYWKEQFPDAIGHSAYLFLDANTTRVQTALLRDAGSAIGYQWDLYEPMDLAAISYKTSIRKMKESGVRFVTFMGAYQQAAKLAREMVEEDFRPDVFANLMNVYDPRLIAEGGTNLEAFPVQLQVVSQLTEEIAGSTELQTYREWLKYIDPGAEPTGLGNYAWAAMRLAYKLLEEIGSEPTRANMVAALEGVRGWTGGDLIPPQDIGIKEPSPCAIITEIRGGEFVRIHPAEPNTFDCSGEVIDVP